MDEDPDSMQDSSLMDEMDDPADIPESAQSGGANTKGSISQGRRSDGNIRVAPEDRIAPADREELDDEHDVEEPEPSFPAHLSISVERPGKGVLEIDAVAQDGLMVIENVNFVKDKKLLEPGNVELANTYTGPPFGNLDEDLQVLFEKYLDERGINTTMALFVPEYIDFKEQKEYLGWLNGVKNFVE
jgi:complement component 1 Q subcomponent-binding protein